MLKPRAIRSYCVLTLLCLLASCVAALPASAPSVAKVEPPNWWIDYVSPVMVLLYGENLAGATVTTDAPGVKIEKLQAEADGKHVFVWLSIGRKAKPGPVTLQVKTASGTTSASLMLAERPSAEGKYSGNYAG